MATSTWSEQKEEKKMCGGGKTTNGVWLCPDNDVLL
jgi:hypothetical protein